MKNARVWVVLGATEGLGPAAVKYLQAAQQIVLPVDKLDLPYLDMTGRYVDFIINNSNYNLFSIAEPDITGNIERTKLLLNAFISYLKRDGIINNIPPQLCLSTLADQSKGPGMLRTMDEFLKALQQELEALHCNLRFLEPGERFVQL
jgi:hypothetical protein